MSVEADSRGGLVVSLAPGVAGDLPRDEQQVGPNGPVASPL